MFQLLKGTRTYHLILNKKAATVVATFVCYGVVVVQIIP
jgi:hypothetical protein